ncbi:bifunctional DNA primase/polymerase [Paracoccus sp. N5]|uniref:bifunctional DNA primase/polymerase n=1 Tax=Paracoccus sp. N5 TaxID=1101189 RepID=UPI0003605F24|nr:bifunctional DNA primase/polymerase [Paracoccus sp. N5]
MTGPFGKNAPAYREAGFPVIPLRADSKAPAVTSFPSFVHNPASDKRFNQWLKEHQQGNIGLVLGGAAGPGHRLVGIDIDDDALVPGVLAQLGVSSCAKRGKKGLTIFARTPEDEPVKSTVIKGGEQHGNIDILADGKQTVIPDSVHPDTKMPYAWVGRPLLETDLTSLPIFDATQLRILKAWVEDKETHIIRSGKTTNEAALRLSAKLVVGGATGEQIMAIFKALLPPDYGGDTLDQLPGMIERARKKGFKPGRKSNSPPKNSAVALEALEIGGLELCHDNLESSYVIFSEQPGIAYDVSSAFVAKRVQFDYYNRNRDALSAEGLKEVIGVLKARALFEGPEREIHLRCGGDEDLMVIDRGADEQNFVHITPEDWEIAEASPFLFRRAPDFGTLPVPERGGDLREMQRILGMPDQAFFVMVLSIIVSLARQGPYLMTMIKAEHGSGKSTITSVIKGAVDPSTVSRQPLIKDERDLYIRGQNSRLLAFDNVSRVTEAMADALCRILTGGGFMTRKLYSDTEQVLIEATRPMLSNGITDITDRPDLIDRSILMSLPPIDESNRKTEAQIKKEVAEAMPRFLGCIYDCLACAMRLQGQIEAPQEFRMADAMHWAVAAEPATGFPEGSFVAAMKQAQEEALVESALTNSVVISLLKLLHEAKDHVFEGLVSQLHEALYNLDWRSHHPLPKTASGLSSAISRLRQSLGRIGIQVSSPPRSNAGRLIRLSLDEAGKKHAAEVYGESGRGEY